MRVKIYPSEVRGEITVPPSKSISHRAIICAGLAKGESVLYNAAESKDIAATVSAMTALGADAVQNENSLTICGIVHLPDIPVSIDCSESGSTLRFMIPICALSNSLSTFIGQGRLLSRPQSVYETVFRNQQLSFVHTPDKITLRGKLKPGKYDLCGNVSSQFITGLLFALPMLGDDSELHILPPFESHSYVDITLHVLRDFGIKAYFTDENKIFIPGRQHYCSNRKYNIDGDYSQLAFFAALGGIKGRVSCTGISHSTVQGDHVIIDIMKKFGTDVQTVQEGFLFSKGKLIAQNIDISDCPDLGPILMVIAAYAQGETKIFNAGRLRLKESDRIAAMEEELTKLGVDIVSNEDTVKVRGKRKNTPENVIVSCHNDHRVAMSLAVFAACARLPVILNDAECVKKSYPLFFEDLQKVGVKIEIL